MILINLTQKKNITNNLIIAKTWYESTIGLLNKPQGTAMLFKTRWGIHTFGMKYPINVLVLNSRMEIVSVKKNIHPNSFYFWNPFHTTIIEFSILKTIPKVGDVLKVIN